MISIRKNFVNVQATTTRIEYLHTVVPFWAASERCEGNTSFAYVLTENSGQQSSIRERTRISFLIGLGAPKCLDLVLLAPLLSMPHFHPLPCLAQTSRFLTQTSRVN
jgi:hypothetical protein